MWFQWILLHFSTGSAKPSKAIYSPHTVIGSWVDRGPALDQTQGQSRVLLSVLWHLPPLWEPHYTPCELYLSGVVLTDALPYYGKKCAVRIWWLQSCGHEERENEDKGTMWTKLSGMKTNGVNHSQTKQEPGPNFPFRLSYLWTFSVTGANQPLYVLTC